jgi:hypothetical protein
LVVYLKSLFLRTFENFLPRDYDKEVRPIFCSLVVSLVVSIAWGYDPQPYDYPEHHKLLLEPDTLAYCMIEIANRYPDSKTTAAIPIDKTYANSYFFDPAQGCEMTPSNLFFYLAADPRRECDYKTGLEEPLRDWIMAQPDNSIDPVKIFEESMELNKGNVFDSLLAIHQLLRNEARYYEKKYYAYQSNPQREKAFWNKFIDIRGDLAEGGGHGDHQGTWYRIWGIMLYRLSQSEKNETKYGEVCSSTSSGMAGRAIADLKTFGVAVSAELVKLVMLVPEDDRWAKIRINAGGGIAGGYLAAWRSNSPLLLGQRDLDRKCKNRGYLNKAITIGE